MADLSAFPLNPGLASWTPPVQQPPFPSNSAPVLAEPVKVPGSIVLAMAKVMMALKTVNKDAENKHQGYKYTSVDGIYDGVRHLMAEAGLVVIPLERSCKKTDGAREFTLVVEFILATEKDTWQHNSLVRTVIHPINGPQSFQAAMSYCEKALFKSLFKINTGEPETEQTDPTQQAQPAKKQQAAAQKPTTMPQPESLAKRLEIQNWLNAAPLDDVRVGLFTDRFAFDHGRLLKEDKDIIAKLYKERRQAAK